MPTFPTFELPKIDLSKIKLPFDLPTIDLSKFELPELPFEMPNVELPSAEQIIDFVKDAALASTGLVSLTAERIADLQKQFVEAFRSQLGRTPFGTSRSDA
jgi:hypothetical protein